MRCCAHLFPTTRLCTQRPKWQLMSASRAMESPAPSGPIQLGASGLMSYATDLKGTIRASARQGAEILRGGNPAEMPYVQGTRFELVINLKTARALGLEIPATLLTRADEVIE